MLTFLFSQLKYFDKDEFADLKMLKRIHLDGNQLSCIIDYLFASQKFLEYLGMYRMRATQCSTFTEH
jgi:hypothetical protein